MDKEKKDLLCKEIAKYNREDVEKIKKEKENKFNKIIRK